MSTQLWIGFGFLALLVVFLIYSVISPPKSSEMTSATVKFLTALCAGFAGGFLTGDALFKMSGMSEGFNYTVSGAAGCALFFTVWFFYPRVFLRDGFEFSVPSNISFRAGVDTFAKSVKFTVQYNGFNDNELASPLQQRQVGGNSVADCIAQLRLITVQLNAVRDYDIKEQGSTYHLTVR